MTFPRAIRARSTTEVDFVKPYVDELARVIDMEAIRGAKLKLGVDPFGSAAVHYW
jgi:phosphoglucomutase